MDDIRYTTTYEIDGVIASGGMGTVYLAKQTGANGFKKTVAIKTIRKRYMADKENVSMLIGEAKLVANLVHENILQVLQLGMRNGAFYIVMEYAHGRDLNYFIHHHKTENTFTDIQIAAFIVSRVARALHCAHTAKSLKGRPLGLVHRDVNPGNIIITQRGVVKLTDFGVAKALTMKTPPENEVLMGKLPYLSPEMAHFEATTPASDVYSLGLVLFELLTNRRVFEVESLELLQELMDSYALAPPSVVQADVPPELDRIVLKATAPDPNLRYKTAQEMGNDLESFMYGNGLGPTNEALSNYIDTQFGPEGFIPRVKKEEEDKIKAKIEEVKKKKKS